MIEFYFYRVFNMLDFHEIGIITAVCSIYKNLGDKANTCTYWGTGYYTDSLGATSVSYCHTIWGDRIRVDATEQWDDGNSGGDDGCNSTWQIERGYQWIGGSLTSPDTWTPVWGEGTRISPETWDDGNLINGDGWDSTWKVETYMWWTGGSKTSKDTCGAICGDGHRINGYETWDDNNLENDDGWSSTWSIERGFKCSGGSYTSADTWVPIWGDGLRVKGEDWDDGNLISGDGCSNIWKVEYEYECKGGSKTSSDKWTEICGDGISIVKNGTTCDDGNKNNYDGWSQDWLIEKDWTCSGGKFTILHFLYIKHL